MVKQGALERTVTLYDVCYVPGSKNLLSHSQVEDQGYCVECHGRRGDRIPGAPAQERLYKNSQCGSGESKTAAVANEAMKRYVAWTERQFIGYKVENMITDGGGEFVNDEMHAWYQKQGIAFLPNPPHSSHLNPFILGERAE
ncbi:hypothetical protein PC117_g17251 [Phytophthora cactorum]|uniref:Integrase catalytic domain-containing protein n=1 Tax=Phytophthora cactorum TaxID=29920 RepID=A0A8T1CB97_9STRA|nr:hypothetical protein PC117_g17251 [Phytophthora cactorum]